MVSAIALACAIGLASPLAAAATTAAASARISPAGVQDFSFASYDADYYLARDATGHSTLRTVETFVAQFPQFDQNRGMIRAIPNDYDGVPLQTEVQSVTDARGNPVPFDVTDDGSFTELALGTDDFVHGAQTYVITYTQRNVVRAFTDTGDDELFWDTNGTGFGQPFGSVTARVHVDPSVAGFLTGNYACYSGPQGSTDRCPIDRTPPPAIEPATPTAPASATPAATPPAGTGVLFSASAQRLGPGENLTVAIGFQPDTFVQVPAETPVDGTEVRAVAAPWWTTVFPLVFLALAVAGALLAILRRLFGPRDAPGRGLIVPQYSVPKGLNLLEAADVVRRDSNALSAQLVSFAVRGNLRILDYAVSPDGGDYTLQLLRHDGLDALESRLLRSVFGSTLTAGKLREIGGKSETLAPRLRLVLAEARTATIARGLRVRRASRAARGIVAGLIAVLVAAVAFFMVSFVIQTTAAAPADDLGLGWGFPVVIALVVAIVIAGAAARPTAILTADGAQWHDYLLGMRDYLQLAEADRFRMLQSPQGAQRVDVGDAGLLVKLYEKLLPFAVLWGVEKEWAKELAVYYDQTQDAPDWYASSSGFNAAVFAGAISGLTSSAQAAATPVTPTSSWSGSGGGSFSGGSFGGGFSGGGGGGGGGGGR